MDTEVFYGGGVFHVCYVLGVGGLATEVDEHVSLVGARGFTDGEGLARVVFVGTGAKDTCFVDFWGC